MLLWRSMIFRDPRPPRPDIRAVIEVLWGVLSLRWGEDWMRDASLWTVWPSGLIVCGVSGQRLPLCVVTVVTKGAIVGTRGSRRAIEPRPSIHLVQQLGEQVISTQEIMQSKQDSYDYFITLISWDYHHFAGNCSDVLTAQQSNLYLFFVKYYATAQPPIHSATNKLYFGGISWPSSPPFLCHISAWASRRGLRDSRTSWISALLSLFSPDPLPLLLAWLDSSMGSICVHGKHLVSGYVSL